MKIHEGAFFPEARSPCWLRCARHAQPRSLEGAPAEALHGVEDFAAWAHDLLRVHERRAAGDAPDLRDLWCAGMRPQRRHAGPESILLSV